MKRSRHYTRLLVCFSACAVVIFTACAKKIGVAYPDPTVDMATSNTPYYGANAQPFQPVAGGASTVVGNATGVKIPGVAALLAGAGSLIVSGSNTQAEFVGQYLMGLYSDDFRDPAYRHLYFTRPDAQTAFSDSLISWGRVGPTILIRSSNTPDVEDNEKSVDYVATYPAYMHYVVGVQTPVANLPASGTAHYTLMGATQPTRIAGGVQGDSLDKAELAVQWGGANTKVGVELTLNSFVHAQTTGGAANPGASQLTLQPGGTLFGGALAVDDLAGPSRCGTAGFTCSANVQGFLAGPQAERAGLAYSVLYGTGTVDPIVGAAAFTSGSVMQVPSAPLAQTNPLTVSIAGGPDIPSFFPGATGSVVQNADLSLSALNYSTGILTLTRGTTVSAEAGGDQIITWGRWVGGQPAGTQFGGAPGPYPGNASLHYVAGVPTPAAALPTSGTATFSLLGATSPTFGNGVGGPGTVTSATLAVAWGGSATTKVGMDMSVSMPGDQAYRILTNGGLAAPASSQIGISAGTSSFTGSVNMPATGRACSGGGCTADVNGFFAGSAAERAALTYSISNGASANGIFGAAAFRR